MVGGRSCAGGVRPHLLVVCCACVQSDARIRKLQHDRDRLGTKLRQALLALRRVRAERDSASRGRRTAAARTSAHSARGSGGSAGGGGASAMATMENVLQENEHLRALLATAKCTGTDAEQRAAIAVLEAARARRDQEAAMDTAVWLAGHHNPRQVQLPCCGVAGRHPVRSGA